MIYAWGITDKGVVRSQNQDSYHLAFRGTDLVTAMVCDGMGGALAGNVASALAIDVASAYLESLTPEELRQTPQEHLIRAVNLANDAVYRKSVTDQDCFGMGTTMVAVIVAERKAWVLNIGDSRCYRLGEDGVVKETRDHSVVEDLLRRGEITAEEARLHPHKNLITRALGAEEKAQPDLYELELKAGECLLLCSDGLSNTLTDQELLYEVLHGGEREECCRRLLDLSLSRGAPDNVTAVLIQIA